MISCFWFHDFFLNQVPALQGAVIEGVATFLCRVVSKKIAEIEPRFGGVLDAAIGTSLVIAGMSWYKLINTNTFLIKLQE